jgi:hypothetical protein
MVCNMRIGNGGVDGDEDTDCSIACKIQGKVGKAGIGNWSLGAYITRQEFDGNRGGINVDETTMNSYLTD